MVMRQMHKAIADKDQIGLRQRNASRPREMALDGLKVTGAKGLDDMLARRRAGDEATLHLFRRDELMSFRVALAEPAADKFTVKRSDRAGADALTLRKSWLGA